MSEEDVTTTPTVVPATPSSAARPRRPRWSRRWLGWAVSLAVLTGGIVLAVGLDTDQFILRPGTIRDTTDLIEIDGAAVFLPEGEISLTTVSITRGVSPAEWVQARYLDGEAELVDRELIDGDLTPDEARRQTQVQMQLSQDAATVAALAQLGYELEAVGVGVTEVQADSPADGLIEVNDVIIGVDGQEVRETEALVTAIRQHGPGEQVTLLVARGDADEPLELTAVLAERPPPDDPDVEVPPDVAEAGFLGVGLATNVAMDAPFEVIIDAGRIRGPSAGLAFSLGIIDVLTEGELTGGTRVAATGTISADGRVGPVGGVRHKTTGARNQGFDLFLTPPENFEEAFRFADGMSVVCVETIGDALLALAGVDGNADEVVAVPLQASEPIVDDDDGVLTCAEVGASAGGADGLAGPGQ